MAAAGNKDWLAKNRTWAIPVGVLVLAAGAAALVGFRYMGTAAAIRKTSAYKQAILRVARNPQVRQQLGDPLEAVSGVEGNLKITGRRGFADFTIPVTGPKGSGTIYVEALLVGGVWQYQHLALQVEGSSKEIVVEGRQPELDLLPESVDLKPETSPSDQLPDIPTGKTPPPDSEPAQKTPKQEPPSAESPDKEESSVTKPAKTSQ